MACPPMTTDLFPKSGRGFPVATGIALCWQSPNYLTWLILLIHASINPVIFRFQSIKPMHKCLNFQIFAF